MVLKTPTTWFPKFVNVLSRVPPTISAACRNPFSISSPNSVKPRTTMLNPLVKKSPTSLATEVISATATYVMLSIF